jgi:dihydroorotate dehydrogenase electron transfer subunit
MVEQVTAEVISRTEPMPDACLLWLWAPGIAKVCLPGQFVMVRCAGSHEPLLRRPLSIHRTAGGEQIALLFNVVGRGTSLLSRCRAGDSIDVLGPLGNGFSVQPASRKLLLLAGGMGIAPLVFLADKAAEQGRDVELLIGAATASLVCPRSLLPSGVNPAIATDDGSAGRRCVVTDLLGDCLTEPDQVFACGPLSMYQAIAAQGLPKGKSVQVCMELAMACGLGACLGCTIKTREGLRQVCQDGPVFELEDVLW